MSNISRHQANTKVAGENAGGQFKSHSRESADLPGELGTHFRQIPFDKENELDWTGAELGLDSLQVVNIVATRCDGDDRSLVVSLREDPVAAGCLTQAQMDRGLIHLKHVFADRYDACDVARLDDGSFEIDLTVDLEGRTELSADEASQMVWNRTKAVQFVNETDKGTFGTPYVYGEIAEVIDNGFFPTPTMPAWEMQETVHFALHQKPADVQWDQLQMLAERGYCENNTQALRQMHACIAERGENNYTRRLQGLMQEEFARRLAAD